MNVAYDLSQGHVAFRTEGLQDMRLEVLRFRGTEGLCQLFRFEIEIATPDPLEVIDGLVGKPAVLSIETLRGPKWFHGIVSRLDVTGETNGQTYLRVELMPTAWLLTHRYQSRIFQNKTVPEIVSDVLVEAGIACDRFQFDLTQACRTRAYCVQYRETDYNFVCRLLEEEGIWWFFEHTKDEHRLVFVDSNAPPRPIDKDDVLRYKPPTGMNVPDEHVHRFCLGQAVRPDAVRLNDYKFEKPRLDLQAPAAIGRHAGLEICDYPGGYRSTSDGARMARTLAEELETGRTVVADKAIVIGFHRVECFASTNTQRNR